MAQDHPLVRFVGEQLRASGGGVGYLSVSAVELHANSTGNVQPGIYVYAVSRWTLSGSRDMERLEYAVYMVGNGALLRGEDAERLVNIAAMEGSDWLGAVNMVDHQIAAQVFDNCKTTLDSDFQDFKESYQREDSDRIGLMVNILEHHRQAQQNRIEDRIKKYRDFGNEKQKKMIPAEQGRLKKQDLRLNEKIAALRLREKLQASDSFVTGGVIRIV